MIEYDRIRSNIKKMILADAPKQDIDGYIASEGVTAQDLRDNAQGKISSADLFGPAPVRGGLENEESQGGNVVSRKFKELSEQNLGVPALEVPWKMATGAAEAYARDPVGTFVSGAAESAKNIATAPSKLVGGVAATGPAVQYALQGDRERSAQYARQALSDISEGATGALEGATILTPVGAATAGARQAGIRSAKDQLRDFDLVGVDPNVATSGAIKGSEAVLKPISENFFAGKAIRDRMDQQIAQSEQAVERVADMYSGADLGTSGRGIITGVREYAGRGGKLYERAFKDIDLSKPVTMTGEFSENIQKTISRFDDESLNEIFTGKNARELVGDMQSRQQISINDLRQLRTVAREAKGSLIKDQDQAAMARLEGLISREIYDAIETNYGGAALARMKAADQHYRKNREALSTSLKPFIAKGVTEEGAYRSVINAARGSGRGDIKRLRALRKSLNQDQMDMVTSAVIREMGYAKEGSDFSPEVFANQWRSMSNGGKSIIFGGANTEARKNLDALANVITRQAKTQSMANRSQSGVSIQNVLTGAGFLTQPLTTTFVVLGGNAAGRALMDPKFTRAILRLQTELPLMGPSTSEAAKRAFAISVLEGSVKENEELQPYVEQIVNTLSTQEQGN